MKRINYALAGLLLFLASSIAVATEQSIRISPGIERILALPEGQIDVGLAALEFAKDAYPNLDVTAYSHHLDELTKKARAVIAMQSRRDPDSVVRALNSYLFQYEGFKYDHESARSRNYKPELFYLNGILDRKVGNCYTMPLLYMAVAQRLGYPVYPVTAPDHIFLRFEDAALIEKNIETSSGGGYESDEGYIKELKISKKGLTNGAYLRTLSYREYLSILLSNNGVHFLRQGNIDKAIVYWERAVKINPRLVDVYGNLRGAYSRLGRQLYERTKDEDIAAEYFDKARKAHLHTEALGLVTLAPQY